MKIYIVYRKFNCIDGVIRNEYLECFSTSEETLEFIMSQADRQYISYFTKDFQVEVPVSKKPIPVDTDKTREVPYIGGGSFPYCKTFEDCTNPQMDCINCPARGNGSTTVYPNGIK